MGGWAWLTQLRNRISPSTWFGSVDIRSTGTNRAVGPVRFRTPTDPPPRAPTNGRPGSPHPGAGGRLPKARRGRVLWRLFVPLMGSLQFSILCQVENREDYHKNVQFIIIIKGARYANRTPQDAGPFFRRNVISRNIGIGRNKPWLPIPDPKPTPAWFGGWMRWRRVINYY